MTNDQAKKQLDEILKNWVQSSIVSTNKNIIGIVQFGSTTREVLKHQTDVDLLIFFDELPQNKMDRSLLIDKIQDPLEIELKKISGYEIYPSVLAKAKLQCDKVAPIYLDMTEHSKILFDPEGFVSSILEKTSAWIKRHGSYKVHRGNLWYWILDPTEPNKKPLSYNFDE
jgi:predicted nucleotidyltransferase